MDWSFHDAEGPNTLRAIIQHPQSSIGEMDQCHELSNTLFVMLRSPHPQPTCARPNMVLLRPHLPIYELRPAPHVAGVASCALSPHPCAHHAARPRARSRRVVWWRCAHGPGTCRQCSTACVAQGSVRVRSPAPPRAPGSLTNNTPVPHPSLPAVRRCRIVHASMRASCQAVSSNGMAKPVTILLEPRHITASHAHWHTSTLAH